MGQLKIPMYLSIGADGYTGIWQDGDSIINPTGPNVPPGLFYDAIEIGITGNASGQSQIVFVDDVVISQFPIR